MARKRKPKKESGVLREVKKTVARGAGIMGTLYVMNAISAASRAGKNPKGVLKNIKEGFQGTVKKARVSGLSSGLPSRQASRAARKTKNAKMQAISSIAVPQRLSGIGYKKKQVSQLVKRRQSMLGQEAGVSDLRSLPKAERRKAAKKVKRAANNLLNRYGGDYSSGENANLAMFMKKKTGRRPTAKLVESGASVAKETMKSAKEMGVGLKKRLQGFVQRGLDSMPVKMTGKKRRKK